MSTTQQPPSLEAFARWLAMVRRETEALDAARHARDAYVAGAKEAKAERLAHLVKPSAFERINLLAAAESSSDQLLPRMRTPSGFSISPIYRLGSKPTDGPTYLLIECPVELVDLVVGQTAYFYSADERVELGKFDSDGKATGALPTDLEIKPPFAFSVGHISELPAPDEE